MSRASILLEEPKERRKTKDKAPSEAHEGVAPRKVTQEKSKNREVQFGWEYGGLYFFGFGGNCIFSFAF